MAHSREYLEELVAETRKFVPGWLFAALMKTARARSGGRLKGRQNILKADERLTLKGAEVLDRLDSLPRDLVVVQDFVSLVGSIAKGKADPGDIDLLVKAAEQDESLAVDARNVWLPLRNTLDPDKLDALSFIFNAQGAHDDNYPLYDLVLRRKTDMVHRVVKSEAPRNVRGLTVSETFAAMGDAKFSQREAAYVEPSPSPSTVCGACRFYLRDEKYAVGQCQVVDGPINWFGTSELYISAEDEARFTLASTEQGEDDEEYDIKEAAKRFIGPVNSPTLFVGLMPEPSEAARGEPLSGLTGVTFAEKYLAPLGLEPRHVTKANILPTATAQAPTDQDIAPHLEPFLKVIDERGPPLVIALGQRAKELLGGRADFVLPHPRIVRNIAKSDELARKIGQLQNVMKQERGEEGGEGSSGETRGENAQRQWEEAWHKSIPTSGGGRFVYQHHWRGLEPEERGLSDAELMKTDHSLHGDLRFEGDSGLFGWAVLVGAAADNRRLEAGDKLLAGRDGLKLAVKLPQPKEWLRVGRAQGTIFEAGDIGATVNKSAKLFIKDRGTYRIGVVHRNSVELFLDGGQLKGRYLLTFPEAGEGRTWLIQRPDDQTPRAETDDRGDLIADLKRKRQRFLFWGSPSSKPEKITLQTATAKAEAKSIAIQKADEEKQIVYGVVLDPYGQSGPETDAHNDWVSPADVEATAHGFAKESRVIRLQHSKDATAQVVETSIEQYPTDADYRAALKNEPHRVLRREFGDDVVHSGAWILGVELGDEEWAAFKRGDLTAFSIGAMGVRTPLRLGNMPEVTFIDLVKRIPASQ